MLIVQKGDEIILSSCISSSVHKEINSRLWFAFPKEYEDLFTEISINGLLASLLLLSMALKESVEIDSIISKKLLRGLQNYQAVFHEWYPNWLTPVKIIPNAICRTPPPQRRMVLSLFSGGVDSFYTLLSHLKHTGKQKSSEITHVLFVLGFDIPLRNKRTFKEAIDVYGKLMDSFGVKLVTCTTNLRTMLDSKLKWELSHGAAAIGTALLMNPSKCYIPSSNPFQPNWPHGSHPRIDHYLSTEACRVIHDHPKVSRIQKIAKISEWKATYNCLRVCWEKPNGLQNCGKCEKCIRTMIELDLFGKLKSYSTFPKSIDYRRFMSFGITEDEIFKEDKKSLRMRMLQHHIQIIQMAKTLARNDILQCYAGTKTIKK